MKYRKKNGNLNYNTSLYEYLILNITYEHVTPPEKEKKQPEKEKKLPEKEKKQPENEKKQPENEKKQPENEKKQPEKEKKQPEKEKKQPENSLITPPKGGDKWDYYVIGSLALTVVGVVVLMKWKFLK